MPDIPAFGVIFRMSGSNYEILSELHNQWNSFVAQEIAQRPARWQGGVHLHRTCRHPILTLQYVRQRAPLVLRSLGVVALFAVLQCVGMGSVHLEAQQSPQDAIVATTLFETLLDNPGSGSVAISVASVALAPGQATLPLEGTGSLLILVESGRVTLLIDHAIDGLSPVDEADNAGGSANTYHLRAGQRITVPSLGTIQFRNESDEPSNLMLLTLVPEGG